MFQNNILVIALALVISINLNHGINQIYLHIKKHLILRYELLSDPVGTVKEFCSDKSYDNTLEKFQFKISCSLNISWKDHSNICDSINSYTQRADRYWIITSRCGIKNINFLHIQSSILR